MSDVTPTNGAPPTEYASDDPVDDDVWLYRLVKVVNCKPVQGRWEFQSTAFANSSREGHEKEMSVVLGDTLTSLERAPEDLPDFRYPAKAEEWGVAKLLAGSARAVQSEEQEVVRSGLDSEPAHGDVVGWKKKQRTRRALKKSASWVVEPSLSPPPDSR